MSYKELWSNTAPVLKQSEENLVYFDNFIQAIESRIEVEENYASSLRSIAETIERQIGAKEQGAMIFVLSALKSDITRRLNQTAIFANSLKTDVLNVIKHPYKVQVAESAKVRQQILDLHAEHFDRWNTLGDSKRELKIFNKIREQQFITLQIHKSRFFINKSEEERILPGVRKAEKEYLDAELRTKEMLRNYNGFLLDFEKRINLNLSILEEQERERGMILLDNMKKILVFEVSMMRNFEYDVTGVSNHLASIEPEKDITDMISKYRGNVPRHPNETMNRVSFMDSTLYGMIKKTFDEKIKLSRDENVQKLLSSLQKGEGMKQPTKKPNNHEEFTKIYKLILYSQTHILDKTDVQQFNELMEKEVHRNFAQLTIRHIVRAKIYNNSNLVSLIQLFVQKCSSKTDTFCLRAIAKLILFDITPGTLKTKQKQLYDKLFSLEIWKSKGFWDACVFQGVQQELKLAQVLKNEDKKEAKARERSIMVAQIEYWCVLMVMMGYEVIRSEELAAKYSKFYNLNQKEYEYISKKILEGGKLYGKLSGEGKSKGEEKGPSK